MQLWWLDITLSFLCTWEDSLLCQENLQTRPEAKVELIRIQISSLWHISVLPLLLHKQNESHIIMLETVLTLSFLLLISNWKPATAMDVVRNRQVQTRIKGAASHYRKYDNLWVSCYIQIIKTLQPATIMSHGSSHDASVCTVIPYIIPFRHQKLFALFCYCLFTFSPSPQTSSVGPTTWLY